MSKLRHHTIMVRAVVAFAALLREKDSSGLQIFVKDFMLLLFFVVVVVVFPALCDDKWGAEYHVSAHWKTVRSCSIQMSAVVSFIFITRMDFLIPRIAQMSLSCLIRQVWILLHHNGVI